ncbi:MAG: hypothetical protein KGD60_09875 [Candidatus Thorarchaeota archaeon]|nr:hypothetical protein [Candidatus Thorarchaeota archaeon]
MTKTTDRYAKWFGTRVPLVSRGGIALLTFLGVLPFSVIMYLGFDYTIIAANWLIAFLLTLLVGVLLHTLILLFQKVRFNNPSTSADFLDIVGRVHQKIVLSPRTHIWVRKSDDIFIASTFNPIFDAIIVSEPMVELILRSPESGEALLAFHLLRVPRTRWFGDLVGSVILFSLLAYPLSLFVVPMAILIGQTMLSGYWYVLASMGSFAVLFMAPILLIFLVKGTFWRHEPAFVGVQEIYGIHPNVAKVQIERGIVLKEEEAQTVIWSVRDWEKRKRGGRRAGVSTIVAILSFLLGIPLFAVIGYLPYTIMMYLAFLPYILAFVGALVAYVVIGRWDKNAMGEVFKKTTDYDEPIWAD